MTNSKTNTINGTVMGIILTGAILLAVGAFIFYLNGSTTKDTEIAVSDTSFEVKGMFGGVFEFDKVSSIEMKETIPAISTKINGSGLGEVCKGRFEVEGLGKCSLYILSKTGPFIYVDVDGKYVIINYKEKEKTEKLYNELLSSWKK